MIATVGGRTLAYDDVGTGEPVLLVHGFPHNRTLWSPQTAALTAHARCLAPDLPGFGESEPFAAGADATSPGMDGYADVLVGLLDVLGIERAVVCGLSMGGYATFALWRRHPERVRALVLVSTRATPDTDDVRAARRALAEVARREGSEAVAERQITGSFGRSTRERRPDLVEWMRRMLAAAPVDGTLGAIDAMLARPDSTPTLATITVPTLVVNGAEDVITGTAEMRRMQEQVRGSRFEVIERAGHACNVERPAAFNHVLAGFLASLATS